MGNTNLLFIYSITRSMHKILWGEVSVTFLKIIFIVMISGIIYIESPILSA